MDDFYGFVLFNFGLNLLRLLHRLFATFKRNILFAQFLLRVKYFLPFSSYPAHVLKLVAGRILCCTTLTKFSDWVYRKSYVFLPNPRDFFKNYCCTSECVVFEFRNIESYFSIYVTINLRVI
jgi:hypothetical protein